VKVRAPGCLLLIILVVQTVVHPATLAGDIAAASETVFPGAGASGPDLHIVHLRLSIWPEYDDPRVLVMFRGAMTPRSAFPARIVLPIPKGVEMIGAGMISEQNELLLHPHQILPQETHDRLELNLPVPRFFVEFYYNPFARGADKRFTYTTPSTYAVERLEVDIQQPLRATHFTTDPPAMRQETDQQGFTSHLFVYRDLGVGEARSFTVSYVKTATEPSVARREPASGVAEPLPTARNTFVQAFGILAGAALVFIGGAWLWAGYQRRRKALPAYRDSSLTPPAVTSPGETQATQMPNFCASCGTKLRPEYRFCPGCGRALRSGEQRQEGPDGPAPSQTRQGPDGPAPSQTRQGPDGPLPTQSQKEAP
jgi:hypothetical protein